VAKSQGRRRIIRNVFGVPPSAIPSDPPRELSERRRKSAREPDFDIDAVRLKPPPVRPPRRKR
jgi:hypothetical protein